MVDALSSYSNDLGVRMNRDQFTVDGVGISTPRHNPPATEAEWRENMRVVFRVLTVQAEATSFAPLDEAGLMLKKLFPVAIIGILAVAIIQDIVFSSSSTAPVSSFSEPVEPNWSAIAAWPAQRLRWSRPPRPQPAHHGDRAR